MSCRSGSPTCFHSAANAFEATASKAQRRKCVEVIPRVRSRWVWIATAKAVQEWGFGLAVNNGALDPGESGLVEESAKFALREAQPDVRIAVLGLIEATAQPITEVVTTQHPEGRGARTGAARGDRMPADWRRSSTALSRRDLLCRSVPRAGVHRHRGPLAARLDPDGSIAGAERSKQHRNGLP